MFMAAIFCFTGCGGTMQTGTENVEQTADISQSQEKKNIETITEPTTEETPQPQAEGTDTLETVGISEVSKQFQTGINQFSYKIFDQLNNGENIFISPYSMAIALSMLDNGANGQTKSEIEQMLGITNLEEWNACAEYYMSQNKEEQAKLLTANSLWLSDDLILSEQAETDFFNPVKKYYRAEKTQIDLSSEEALKQINRWVSEHTENMIDKLLTDIPNEDVKMILLNAVYFKGEWKEKFEKENTVKGKFYGKDKTVEGDMMYQNGKSYRYVEKHGIKAIELPYANDNIVMDILLPTNEKKNINEVFSKLSDKEKANIFKKLSKTEPEKIFIVAIPKFSMEYGVKEITDNLKALGMKQAFEGEKAEFSKIAPQLYASNVFHKAKIEVDEEGTKAAAVTEIEMKQLTCAVGEKTFIADRPFMFVIRDKENDMILFMGEMQNLGE